MTRICFVRHGETDWNSSLKFQGQIDIALNAVGLRQSEALESAFAGLGVAAIYSSDLSRARQTAMPIARATGLPIVPVDALRERHFGRCEGLTIEEIADRYPQDAAAIEMNDPDYQIPGGESRRQLNDRVLGCIDVLVSRHASELIVVVTHGGVLDVVYRRSNELPLSAPRNYPIPNAGLNWLSIHHDRWLIEAWGKTPPQKSQG